jgi:hypothetical protein
MIDFLFKQNMGILGHAWDAITSTLPMGGAINKLGRMAGNYVSENRDKIAGLAGKALGAVGREFIPQGARDFMSKAADTALSVLPDSKVKTTLQHLNNSAQERPNEYKKSDVTINPTSDVYNSATVKQEKANDTLHTKPSPQNFVPDIPRQTHPMRTRLRVKQHQHQQQNNIPKHLRPA